MLQLHCFLHPLPIRPSKCYLIVKQKTRSPMKNSLSKLRQIFLYYDSEPLEFIQGILWMLFMPFITCICQSFNCLVGLTCIFVGFLQISSILNSSLIPRKRISFLIFLCSTSVTTYTILHNGQSIKLDIMIYVFSLILAIFILIRLTVENIKTKWIK